MNDPRFNMIVMVSVIGGLWLVVIAIRLLSPDPAPLPPAAPAPPPAPTHLELSDGCFGAADLDAFDHAMRLIGQHDTSAAADLIATDPALFLVPKGLRVVSMDVSVFHGAEKVRPVGKAAEFWTPNTCLRRVPDTPVP